jgi:hypothetical protein
MESAGAAAADGAGLVLVQPSVARTRVAIVAAQAERIGDMAIIGRRSHVGVAPPYAMEGVCRAKKGRTSCSLPGTLSPIPQQSVTKPRGDDVDHNRC